MVDVIPLVSEPAEGVHPDAWSQHSRLPVVCVSSNLVGILHTWVWAAQRYVLPTCTGPRFIRTPPRRCLSGDSKRGIPARLLSIVLLTHCYSCMSAV
ncbi:uncharacterized protein B0H18DRAFT_1003417, partial [Fomitopsis serialis]|uniref:uncharacterized protein n=1 Tax=Fomitopsis serialis TaxID=139415 RepID=UPI002007D919